MPRLFAAVEIGPAAEERVAQEQARLARQLRGNLRWVRRDQLHLTLVFLGEVSREQTELVIHAWRDPIPEARFHVELGGIGVFPARGAPRALWLGLKSGRDAVVRVHGHVAARLGALGVPLDQRPFNPHVTLARWRESRPSDRPNPAAGGSQTVARVEAGGVTLFQSRVSSAGSTYTRLAVCRLGETGAAAS
jgi:2'-5' RNA ligase